MGGEYKLVLATQYFFCQCIPISWVSSADTSPGVEVSIYHDPVWVSAVPLCLEWAILCSSEVISLLLSGRVGWWAFVIFHRAAAFFLNKGLGLSQQAILHLGIGGALKQNFASEASLAVLAVIALPRTFFRYYYTFTLVKWPFCALDTIRMYLDRAQYHPYNKYILRECLGGTADGTE